MHILTHIHGLRRSTLEWRLRSRCQIGSTTTGHIGNGSGWRLLKRFPLLLELFVRPLLLLMFEALLLNELGEVLTLLVGAMEPMHARRDKKVDKGREERKETDQSWRSWRQVDNRSGETSRPIQYSTCTTWASYKHAFRNPPREWKTTQTCHVPDLIVQRLIVHRWLPSPTPPISWGCFPRTGELLIDPGTECTIMIWLLLRIQTQG